MKTPNIFSQIDLKEYISILDEKQKNVIEFEIKNYDDILSKVLFSKVEEIYYNVNDKIILGDIRGNDYGYQSILDWYEDFIEEYIPMKSLPNPDWTSGYRGSAQFLVHKDIIRCLPKKFYENLYTWITRTTITSAQSGRFLEWTWHLFWYIYPILILNK
jgi:hypothetical protein